MLEPDYMITLCTEDGKAKYANTLANTEYSQVQRNVIDALDNYMSGPRQLYVGTIGSKPRSTEMAQNSAMGIGRSYQS